MGASKTYRFNLQKPTTKWLSKGTVVIYMKIFINNTHPTNIYLNDLISYIIWDLKICLNTEIQVPSNCSPYVYKCVTHVLQLFTLKYMSIMFNKCLTHIQYYVQYVLKCHIRVGHRYLKCISFIFKIPLHGCIAPTQR